MSKVRCFVSFDYDNDMFLKEALIEQSRKHDSPFEISDLSLKEAISGEWESVARSKIIRSELVIVLCGKNTDKATGVAKELKIAQEEQKDYFLLEGYKNGDNKKPITARPSDYMYDWTWDNLKILINGER